MAASTSSDRSVKKEKNQNIQVFVRLRPLNSRERAIRSIGVVDVVNGREVVVRQSQHAPNSHTKKFTFDKAFGPGAQQLEVYKEVVSPLIAEVLAGYNCTVFAYGQTGTGKTHTMVGESSSEETSWQDDPLSGIIPRALSQLFDELRLSSAEYTVRVSYLELYNEELFDLLSTASDNSKLRIYEDVNRKGSTIVNGLEEIAVYNKNEVYEIMAKGQERKKVASTLMNAQSSNHPKYLNGLCEPRSHTVFTIVVHTKENFSNSDELVKIGKLNLVDLAGSENISKAGSDNPAKKERARECVNINQSLLTLGRVITALVEKHPHIPYRESKLTRILQESLGGRTKTSIIATISPGHKDIEETMSTLEYANRAKNIQNKPEVNQRLTKQALLKEFSEELDKVKKELAVAREKSGVYLSLDKYDDMIAKSEEQKNEIMDLLHKKRAMEEERARMQKVFQELERTHETVAADLGQTRAQLDNTAAALEETAERRLEAEHLVSRHVATETSLTAQAKTIMAAAARAAGDVNCLHDSVDRRKDVESTNKEIVLSYREQSTAQRSRMLDGLAQFGEQFGGVRQHLQAAIDDHTRDVSLSQESTIQDARLLRARLEHFINEIRTLTRERSGELSSALSECGSALESSCGSRRQALERGLATALRALARGLERAGDGDGAQTVARAAQQWLSGAMERVSCLQRGHATYSQQSRALEGRREDTVRRHARDRAAQNKAREAAIAHGIQEIENDKKAIEERMASQLALIESEREDTETRLQQWIEQERRSLEERMARHVEAERNALNIRLERHMSELDKQRSLYSESAAKLMEMQRAQLQLCAEEVEMERKYGETWARERADSEAAGDLYGKEFEEGTLAITAEMESFSSSVVHIVEHITAQLMGHLRETHGEVQLAIQEVSSQDLENSEQFSRATRAAVTAAIDSAAEALATVLHKTEEATSTATQTLATVWERTSAAEAASQSHQSVATASLNAAAELASDLSSGLRDQIATHEELEGRYLLKEYRVYLPTGNTPMRREYRYPRRLAQTSPHERILARVRVQRQNGVNGIDSPVAKDIIVVEEEEGRHTSDSDSVSESSGVSEDSAVAMQ